MNDATKTFIALLSAFVLSLNSQPGVAAKKMPPRKLNHNYTTMMPVLDTSLVPDPAKFEAKIEHTQILFPEKAELTLHGNCKVVDLQAKENKDILRGRIIEEERESIIYTREHGVQAFHVDLHAMEAKYAPDMERVMEAKIAEAHRRLAAEVEKKEQELARALQRQQPLADVPGLDGNANANPDVAKKLKSGLAKSDALKKLTAKSDIQQLDPKLASSLRNAEHFPSPPNKRFEIPANKQDQIAEIPKTARADDDIKTSSARKMEEELRKAQGQNAMIPDPKMPPLLADAQIPQIRANAMPSIPHPPQSGDKSAPNRGNGSAGSPQNPNAQIPNQRDPRHPSSHNPNQLDPRHPHTPNPNQADPHNPIHPDKASPNKLNPNKQVNANVQIPPQTDLFGKIMPNTAVAAVPSIPAPPHIDTSAPEKLMNDKQVKANLILPDQKNVDAQLLDAQKKAAEAIGKAAPIMNTVMTRIRRLSSDPNMPKADTQLTGNVDSTESIAWDKWHSDFAKLSHDPILDSIKKAGSPCGDNTIEVTVLPNHHLTARISAASKNKAFDEATLKAYLALDGNDGLKYPDKSRRSSVTFLVDNKHDDPGAPTGVKSQTSTGDKEILHFHNPFVKRN